MAHNQIVFDSWDFIRNARIVRTAMEYSTLLPDYLNSRPLSNDGIASFDGVHTYAMFVGVGRSGTTLVGALLDAHPNVIMANQQNALKYLYPFSFSRERIFRLLLKNAARQAEMGRPGGGGYSYAVPGQFQGAAETIQVIGDKSKSDQSVEWFASRPDLLERLSRTTRVRIKLLYVIRNPYDTIARRSLWRQVSVGKISREYFALIRQLKTLLGRIEENQQMRIARVALHLEDLIRQPAAVLTQLCDDLGIQASPAYLEACAGIVYKKPTRARDLLSWSAQHLDEIQREIEEVPWLRRYSFEGD